MLMTEIAVDEIVRVGRWSLRGLGMAFGVTERACHLLAWAEAVEGGAIASLEHYDHLQMHGNVGNYRLERRDQQRWLLEAQNRSLMEVGPIAVDLLTYAARSFGAGRVDMIGINDPVFASGLCRLLALRGLAAWALSGGPLSRGGEPVGRIHARPSPSGTTVFMPSDAIPKQLSGAAALGEDAPARAGSLSLVAYAPSALDAPGPGDVVLEEKLAHARTNGIPIPLSLLKAFYEYELRTWAPTSDRSRSQALV